MLPEERDRLTREMIPAVERMARRVHYRLGRRVPEDELRSLGLSGLVESLERFDPERGVNFESFAMPRIRGAMYDGAARQSPWSRRMLRDLAFHRAAEDQLAGYADEPPPADRVEAVHRLATRLKDLAATYMVSSAALAERLDDPGQLAWAETGASRNTNPEEHAAQQELARRMRFCLDAMPSQQQEILRLHFYEHVMLIDIGARLGISKSWVSKQFEAGLAELRRLLSGVGVNQITMDLGRAEGPARR